MPALPQFPLSAAWNGNLAAGSGEAKSTPAAEAPRAFLEGVSSDPHWDRVLGPLAGWAPVVVQRLAGLGAV